MGRTHGASPESGWPLELKTPSVEEVAANYKAWQEFQEILWNGIVNASMRGLDTDRKVLAGLTGMLDFIHDNRRALDEAGLLTGLMSRIKGLVTEFMAGMDAYQDLFHNTTEAYRRARR